MDVGMHSVLFGGKTLERKVHNEWFISGVLLVENSYVWCRERWEPFCPVLNREEIIETVLETSPFKKLHEYVG